MSLLFGGLQEDGSVELKHVWQKNKSVCSHISFMCCFAFWLHKYEYVTMDVVYDKIFWVIWVVVLNKKLVVVLIAFQINIHNKGSKWCVFLLFAGNTVSELGHTVFQGAPFLDLTELGGFIYIRPSFQCLQKLILPPSPYLVALLVHRYLCSTNLKKNDVWFT